MVGPEQRDVVLEVRPTRFGREVKVSLPPLIFCSILRWSHMVQPSFKKKWFHVLFVTKLPVQEWAISRATTSARDLSP